jgi:streptomycin 3"-adenylyltransferase
VRQKASSSRASWLPTAPVSWQRRAAGSSSAAPSRRGRSHTPRRGARLNSAALRYAGAVAERLREALDTDLVGLYLHGSATLGDYDPARSDIDLLAVCAAPLTAPVGADIAARLGREALPCPAQAGLEFSLITRAAALDASPAPAYELHGWDAEGRLRADPGAGDPDLPRHFALVRDTGVAVAGPPPADVFRAVGRAELVTLAASELAWTAAHASPGTQVLTACRAWCLAEEGRFRSKRAAAEWAIAHGAPPMLVTEVLADHIAARPSRPDPAAVAAFTASVLKRIQHK